MRIEKDKKYLKIYSACCVIASIVTGFVVWFLIFLSKYDLTVANLILLIIIPFFAIVGDIFAFNSFLGYVKTPDVILEINDDSITFTPDRKKTLLTLKLSDIKDVEIYRPLICRSGKRVLIHTEDSTYRLEDINDADAAFNMIKEALKGRE